MQFTRNNMYVTIQKRCLINLGITFELSRSMNCASDSLPAAWLYSASHRELGHARLTAPLLQVVLHTYLSHRTPVQKKAGSDENALASCSAVWLWGQIPLAATSTPTWQSETDSKSTNQRRDWTSKQPMREESILLLTNHLEPPLH